MGWTKSGVERIKGLTAKQEDMIAVFAEKWDRIARSTEPWDRRAVAAGIRQFYKAFGAHPPKRVCGYDSVVEAWNAAAYETGRWDSEQHKKFWQDHPNFYDVERSEWGVRCLIGQSFEPPVIKVVEDFMHRNIARSLALWRIGEIEEAKEDIRERHGRRIVYGQSNARWLAIVDYFATVHGNPHCQKLNGLLQAVASCGAIWLAAEKAVYCNRPKVARFDEQGRLHHDDDVAIRYRDGWGFYSLHGVGMRKQFVENPAGEINIDDVLALRNSEVRRAVLGKIGFPRMLATFKHRVISRAGENRLIQFKVKGFAGREYFRVLHLKWKDDGRQGNFPSGATAIASVRR